MNKDTLFPILETYFQILLWFGVFLILFILAIMSSNKRDSVTIFRISKALMILFGLITVGYVVLALIFLTM